MSLDILILLLGFAAVLNIAMLIINLSQAKQYLCREHLGPPGSGVAIRLVTRNECQTCNAKPVLMLPAPPRPKVISMKAWLKDKKRNEDG